jgi:hypothetical protein
MTDPILIQKVGGQHAGPVCSYCRAAWDGAGPETDVHKSCVDCLFDEGLPPENFTA